MLSILPPRFLFILLVIILIPLMNGCGSGPDTASNPGTIDPQLQQVLRSLKPSDPVMVIVKLREQADVDLIEDRNVAVRREKVVRALREKADLTQRPVLAHFGQIGAQQVKQLWICNSVAATVRADQVAALAAVPGVASVILDAEEPALPPVVTSGTSTAPGWNLDAISSRNLWSLGYTGQGIVVASIDTGVKLTHPDLQPSWRGGSNSWYDPYNQHATPVDYQGHGTSTMSLIVGGSASGTAIGVAPGAKWIAARKNRDDGSTILSYIHLAFQWLLDPDRNAATNDAPDVVNLSWQLTTSAGTCDAQFRPDIQALKAANIAVVVAAGNTGPAASTSTSPANYPESFSAGAVDYANTIYGLSARGPSACSGAVFPNVSAPGVDVYIASIFNPDYTYSSGTSYAAPHVAGAMALLLSAFPGQSVSMLETALKQTASDLGATGPDNIYGYGLINVLAAYQFLDRSNINVFVEGRWFLDINRNGVWDNTPTDAIAYFGSGWPNAIPVVGDWTGGGTKKIGAFYNGTWTLDLNGNGLWDGPPADGLYSFGIGWPGAIPVVGDWTGTGTMKIGVFVPSMGMWNLDLNGNGVWDGPAIDALYSYGAGWPNPVPVVGDWTATGTSKIGIFDHGVWTLDLNGNGAWDDSPTDGLYHFGEGWPNPVPVVGNWTGTRKTMIGIFDNGVWTLDLNGNGAWEGPPTDGLYHFGEGWPNPVPVVGDWTGTGLTSIGVFNDGTWTLDLNGNGAWEGPPTDGMYYFGVGFPVVVPVVAP